MSGLAFSQLKTDHLPVPNNITGEAGFDVLRLDQIHPLISGNKWFKLQFYLEEAKSQNKKRIYTFGGAWSNHLLATAAACQMMGFESTGIVRGEKPSLLSQTLQKAGKLGMQFHFTSRTDYRLKKLPGPFSEQEDYMIPEGGYGNLGALGAGKILDYIDKDQYTHVCAAVGTGTTLAGLINAASTLKVIGISVLKNNKELKDSIDALLVQPARDYELLHDYSFGGYAKQTPALIDFMNAFYNMSGIPSDIVYTAKLFFAVTDLLNLGYFSAGSKILVIHSGGLPGNASLPAGTLSF